MGHFCFRPAQRVLKSKDFQHLSRIGSRVFVKDFLAVVADKQTEQGRLGITVSKRCSKKAVVRNRIKRIIRESFRVNADKLQNKDVLVIAKAHADEKNNHTLDQELNRLWRKVLHG